MRTVTVIPGETVQLGYQYDNDATTVIFPSTIINEFLDRYGSAGTFGIWYKRSGDSLGYPIGYPLVQFSANRITWLLTEAELANPGSSQIQLRYVINDVCVMSQIFNGIVSDSVDIGSEIPAPMQAWADQVVNAAAGLAATGLSEDIKEALLDCFEHVAWIDDQGQTYVDALEEALYPPAQLVSITAVYTQTGTVYDTDDVDDLKADLVVTAHYDNLTTETVASTDYTLSGTLTEGTSTITVTYEGKTTTFSVVVTHMPGTYTVTNTLTGAANSNSDATVTEYASYTGTITATSGYTLTGATVSITMDGVDITSTAYNNGTISITSVTGNLVITVTAVAVTLSSISAVYTQSGTVYTTDSLDSLKSDLVVTATYSDSSTATVASTDYTLSGTLTEGTSTITVSYGGKTTTFTVTVSAHQLPSGYTAYDYVYNNTANDNTHMLNTQISGVYCGSGYEHELTFLVENSPQSTSYPIYGLRATTGSDPKARALWTKTDANGNLACNYNGIDTGFIFTMSINTKYKSVTANDQWKINDVVIRDNMNSGSYSPYENGNIQLWGIQTGTNAWGGYTRHTMRIYGFKVKNISTGEYIADMIPCKNSSDVAGFYDVIREAFYTATTQSKLSAGNDQ